MKRLYRKPLIFPTWGIFSGKDAGKIYYRLTDGGVIFTPEKDKLPHHNHIEMTGFGTVRATEVGKRRYESRNHKAHKLFIFENDL